MEKNITPNSKVKLKLITKVTCGFIAMSRIKSSGLAFFYFIFPFIELTKNHKLSTEQNNFKPIKAEAATVLIQNSPSKMCANQCIIQWPPFSSQ